MIRREFLRRGLESALLLYCAVELPAAAAVEPRAGQDSLRRLEAWRAFVDTLIPADSTPSATQLGLDRALEQHAESIENYPRLLALGCEWLDTTATRLHGASFDRLKLTQQEAVVTLAETSPENSIPRMFFDRVRFDLMGLYYAAPASWDGLGISSPPQPAGYPDFARAPRKRGRG
jgi:hypothetical protein